jgi:hypothetical protein
MKTAMVLTGVIASADAELPPDQQPDAFYNSLADLLSAWRSEINAD